MNACQRAGAAPVGPALGGGGGAYSRTRHRKRPSADCLHGSGVKVAGDELSKVDGVDAGSCHSYEQNGGLAKHDDLFVEDFGVLIFLVAIGKFGCSGHDESYLSTRTLKLCIRQVRKEAKVHIFNSVSSYTYGCPVCGFISE